MQPVLIDREDTDLSREVYCILGIPVDLSDRESVLGKIQAAALQSEPFLLSTPNLNFLILSRSDPRFRESLIMSDLCPADGAAIVLVARLLGIPIKDRIAGADIFDLLRADKACKRPIRVFLFGGAEGVATAAGQIMNQEPGGLACVGSLYPGFGSLDEMSSPAVMNAVNASGAEFLIASLGAKKGQEWLLRNHQALQVPVRAHFGAALNFQAGTVDRAPPILRKLGLEWLWRIKEEPLLWRRYWNDGRALLHLVISKGLLLSVWSRYLSMKYRNQEFIVRSTSLADAVTVSLMGPAIARHADDLVAAFKEATLAKKQLIVDLSGTTLIDARVLGVLLMLRKRLQRSGVRPIFEGVSPRLKRMFYLNGVSYLLSTDDASLGSAPQVWTTGKT